MQPVAHRDPALFRRGMSPASKCLIGLSLSAALVALDGRASWSSSVLRGALEGAIAPVAVALQMPLEAAREVGRGFSTQGDLLRQIARLQAENAELRTLSRDLDALQRENDQLRQLAGIPTEQLRIRRIVELVQSGRGMASQRFLIASGTRATASSRGWHWYTRTAWSGRWSRRVRAAPRSPCRPTPARTRRYRSRAPGYAPCWSAKAWRSAPA
jgi:hypothetical protein